MGPDPSIVSTAMDVALDLTGFAYALGRARAAWRFAGDELRKAAALASVSAAWDIFQRDAGAGNVGPAHETTSAAALLLFTENSRRDAVLLWLADHAVSPIAEVAATLARMVGSARRFGPEEQALLEAARDVLAHPITVLGQLSTMVSSGAPSDNPVVEPVRAVAAAVDRLRREAGFLEGGRAEVRHALPGGTFSHFVPAEPGGCWALNLALLAQGAQAAAALPPPGQVSRALFRRDLEPEEIAG